MSLWEQLKRDIKGEKPWSEKSPEGLPNPKEDLYKKMRQKDKEENKKDKESED